jgi:hypothetical protein
MSSAGWTGLPGRTPSSHRLEVRHGHSRPRRAHAVREHPVADLERSKAFFAKLGFSFDPMSTDETAACMLVGEHAFVMLLSREKFAECAKLPIADRRSHHAPAGAALLQRVATNGSVQRGEEREREEPRAFASRHTW